MSIAAECVDFIIVRCLYFIMSCYYCVSDIISQGLPIPFMSYTTYTFGFCFLPHGILPSHRTLVIYYTN